MTIETVCNFKPYIELDDENFGAVLNCAIRYCLGRETYMPGLVTDFIRPLLPYLSKRTVKVMWDDIRSAGHYGDPKIDEPMWMVFLGDLVAELDRRDEE